jgi:hypothetical protein
MEPACFLNIDLDVRSRRSLAPLAAAWPSPLQRFVPLGRSNSRWLILNSFGRGKGAEATAKELLEHIAALRGDARRCWKDAHRRVFDIGVQAGGPDRRAFEEVRLTAKTLGRIAAAGAEVHITVYPAVPES